jgi:hypothetical protein
VPNHGLRTRKSFFTITAMSPVRFPGCTAGSMAFDFNLGVRPLFAD